MLTFCFSGTVGYMKEEEVLTSGMVGKQVMLELSPDWEGLSKTVVFSNGEVTRDVLYGGGAVTIPAAVLEKPLKQLVVGLCGVSGDGKVVIPTIRAEGPWIRPGVEPSGDVSTDPDLPVWAQLQAAVEELAERIPEDGATSGGTTEETDPTVPDWAKQPEKPTYTAQEVGALPADTEIPAVPTALSAFTDDVGYAKASDTYTKAQIDEALGTYITDIDTMIGGDG